MTKEGFILVDHFVFLLVLVCHYDPINIPLTSALPAQEQEQDDE